MHEVTICSRQSHQSVQLLSQIKDKCIDVQLSPRQSTSIPSFLTGHPLTMLPQGAAAPRLSVYPYSPAGRLVAQGASWCHGSGGGGRAPQWGAGRQRLACPCPAPRGRALPAWRPAGRLRAGSLCGGPGERQRAGAPASRAPAAPLRRCSPCRSDAGTCSGAGWGQTAEWSVRAARGQK